VHLLNAKASNINSKVTVHRRITDMHRNTAMILFYDDKHKSGTGNDLEISIFVCRQELYIKLFIVYFRTLYQDISLQTLPDLRSDFKKVRHKSHFAQVSIQYTYDQLYMYIQASPFEIETETH